MAVLPFFIFPFAVFQCFPKHSQILKSCSITKTDGKGSLGVAEWTGWAEGKTTTENLGFSTLLEKNPRNWKIYSEQFSAFRCFVQKRNKRKKQTNKNFVAHLCPALVLVHEILAPLRMRSRANWETVLKYWWPCMVWAAELSCLVTFLQYFIHSIEYSMAICLMEKKMENTWARITGKKLDCFFSFLFFYWHVFTYFDGIINDLCCHAIYVASRVGLRWKNNGHFKCTAVLGREVN